MWVFSLLMISAFVLGCVGFAHLLEVAFNNNEAQHKHRTFMHGFSYVAISYGMIQTYWALMSGGSF